MTAGDTARYSRLAMKALQPTGSWATAITMFVVVLVTTLNLGAQSTAVSGVASTVGRPLDRLSRRGVFEGTAEIDAAQSTPPASASDDRIRWLTFYQIYTDDVLSRYAPGGAVGARFDLFQFAGFSGAQPSGYPIHIIVSDGRTTLMGVVDIAGDKQLAEVRAREVPGVVNVENALVVAQ